MNVARATLALLLVAFSLAACDNGDLPPPGSYASVHGTVLDAVTHKPIANATVVVDTVLSQTTDAQGNFSFDKVPSGIIDYVVKAPGYTELTSSGNADPGKQFQLIVSMQPPHQP